MEFSGNFILVKFSRISRLVEFSKFFRHKVDISKNLRLIDPSRFPKFLFRVKVIYYRVSPYIMEGNK